MTHIINVASVPIAAQRHHTVNKLTVGVISQLAVLVSVALGVAFLGEHITAMAALGATLAIGGVVGVVYVTSLAKRTVIAADEVAPES